MRSADAVAVQGVDFEAGHLRVPGLDVFCTTVRHAQPFALRRRRVPTLWQPSGRRRLCAAGAERDDNGLGRAVCKSIRGRTEPPVDGPVPYIHRAWMLLSVCLLRTAVS